MWWMIPWRGGGGGGWSEEYGRHFGIRSLSLSLFTVTTTTTTTTTTVPACLLDFLHQKPTKRSTLHHPRGRDALRTVRPRETNTRPWLCLVLYPRTWHSFVERYSFISYSHLASRSSKGHMSHILELPYIIHRTPVLTSPRIFFFLSSLLRHHYIDEGPGIRTWAASKTGTSREYIYLYILYHMYI